MTLPVFVWHKGDITLAIACSTRVTAALAMNVDERDVYNCLNPATGRRCNELPGVVLVRDMGSKEGPYFNERDRNLRRSRR
jgi:hypothetical protein